MCTEYDGPWGAEEPLEQPPYTPPPMREMTEEEYTKYCQLMNELVEIGG